MQHLSEELEGPQQKLFWHICTYIYLTGTKFNKTINTVADSDVESCYFLQSHKGLPPCPEKNPIKIDSVKMQRKQYTNSPSKAEKQNILLFTRSTQVCTVAHNNITSTSPQLKQIHTTTFTILEIIQQN